MCKAISFKCVREGIIKALAWSPSGLTYYELHSRIKYDTKQQFDRQLSNTTRRIDDRYYLPRHAPNPLAIYIELLKEIGSTIYKMRTEEFLPWKKMLSLCGYDLHLTEAHGVMIVGGKCRCFHFFWTDSAQSLIEHIRDSETEGNWYTPEHTVYLEESKQAG